MDLHSEKYPLAQNVLVGGQDLMKKQDNIFVQGIEMILIFTIVELPFNFMN